MIYEYALSYDDGLLEIAGFTLPQVQHFQPMYYTTAQLRSHGVHFTRQNPLRYVCRQLYQETTGLALKFNDLTWHGKDRVSPSGSSPPAEVYPWHWLERFLFDCSATRLDWIRKITILDNGHPQKPHDEFHVPFGPSSLIHHFCVQHPNATVIARFNWQNARSGGGLYIFYMAMVHRSLRGSYPFPFLRGIINRMAMWRQRRRGPWIERQWPSNLRISVSNYFLRGRARDALSSYCPDADVEELVGVAKELHDNGI